MEILKVKKGEKTIMPCHCIDEQVPDDMVASQDGWTIKKAKENGILLLFDPKIVSTKGFFLSEAQLKEIGYVKSRNRKK